MRCPCVLRPPAPAPSSNSVQTGSPMSGEPRTASLAEWTRAVELDRLQPSRPIAVKLRGKHVALFLHQGEILACNNRCPHEGYPLVEGALDADCVLTCNWHNWKFDLRTGATIYGGDNLRIYPVKVEDGAVWLDTRDPPAAERIERALAASRPGDGRIRHRPHRARACAPRQGGCHARTGAGARHPGHARAAARRDDARLRGGRSVAAPARYARRTKRRASPAPPKRSSHIAFDTLREETYPFTAERAPWNAEDFAAAIESQDEDGAAALLNGALAQGLHFADLEPALAAAALAHYNDFGHSLIYLMHVRRLIERLGTERGKAAAAGMAAVADSRHARGPAARFSPLCRCACGLAGQRAAGQRKTGHACPAPTRSKGNRCATCWTRPWLPPATRRSTFISR